MPMWVIYRRVKNAYSLAWYLGQSPSLKAHKKAVLSLSQIFTKINDNLFSKFKVNVINNSDIGVTVG